MSKGRKEGTENLSKKQTIYTAKKSTNKLCHMLQFTEIKTVYFKFLSRTL